MLQITTTNGDTMIHGDGRPEATIRSYDGSEVIVHAKEWGNHKYIRKEGNRYIYPEDLQRSGSHGPKGRKRNMLEGGMDVKIRDKRTTVAQMEKDKEFVKYSPNQVNKRRTQAQAVTNAHQNATVKDEKHENLGGYSYRDGEYQRQNPSTDNMKQQILNTEIRRKKEYESKEREAKQITNAHNKFTAKKGDNGYVYYDAEQYRNNPDLQSAGVKKQKAKTAKRKADAAKVVKEHQNATTHRKGSTEELERQKQKTAQRKQAKETVERTSDTLERMRNKALKKRNRG